MLVKVSDHISFLISDNGFTYCNCIFIDDDIKAILDTGAGKTSLDEIHPEQVDLVINTHHHYDHIRGNHYFKQAQIMIHSLDRAPLTSREENEYYNSINIWQDLMPDSDYNEAGKLMGIVPEDVVKNMRVDAVLEDGQIIEFGHTSLEVLHTPGHSAGHCSFWFPEEEFLFTGDICLTQAGPWYGEIYANPADMIKSIERIIDLNPPRLASCHVNNIYYDQPDRLIEFRDRIYKREEKIYNYLKTKPADVHDIAAQKLIYKLHPTPFVLFWEKLMVLKHLESLEQAGRIEVVANGYYRAK